ncbi:bifunctional tetrahydrofolate synthase/dihydrofolate synthase [Lysobacter sp. A03]|uniref:bifunctional tetrahydrofolate synthase/dihydrofolate synthase n=1 Tax=Lysobacter sp. A03 TaxID=1199154 RepID=UPI0005B723F3|nr:bifunctional tetrahydrofolate synthase/dihydrofolate synthase [Lysobacter sp. A03]KIQ96076.1 Dihydrofolate synthase [Lysobacter sp. A03]
MNLSQWLDRIEQLHPKSIDMGLERIGAVAGRLGIKRPARRVITVGGTNGKGSTVAFIEAIGRAAGWRVGAYTSPHLLAYNERIRIDGVDAEDATIVAAFEAIEAARGDTPLTYFEYGTLAALWLFQRADLDLAVLEVGLGGRLDATNVVDPDVAAITTVDVDHQDYLGEGREAIGHEKAGIARAWKPLVLGDDDPPSSVLRHAYSIAAKTLRIGCDFFVDLPGGTGSEPDDSHAVAARQWRWREVGHRIDLPLPRLAGQMQLRNAAVAIAALRALDKSPPDRAVVQGVADARIRGRLQRFERDGVDVVVDVGHNPQAAHALADWLAATPVVGKTHAVYAALVDKDLVGAVSALATSVDHWHLAGLATHAPRGVNVEDFAIRLAGTAAEAGQRHDTVDHALDAALALASPGDRVLVFGSFHTAAEALTLLEQASPTPPS